MATIQIHIPDELRRRMDDAGGEDWSRVARQAFESHLERLTPGAGTPGHQGIGESGRSGDPRPEETGIANAAYHYGYAWARDRAFGRDLRAMVNASNYRSAVDIVRRTQGFSQREEFGDCAYPSDEMWEAFVDGATARYNERAK